MKQKIVTAPPHPSSATCPDNPIKSFYRNRFEGNRRTARLFFETVSPVERRSQSLRASVRFYRFDSPQHALQ